MIKFEDYSNQNSKIIQNENSKINNENNKKNNRINKKIEIK